MLLAEADWCIVLAWVFAEKIYTRADWGLIWNTFLVAVFSAQSFSHDIVFSQLFWVDLFSCNLEFKDKSTQNYLVWLFIDCLTVAPVFGFYQKPESLFRLFIRTPLHLGQIFHLTIDELRITQRVWFRSNAYIWRFLVFTFKFSAILFDQK